MAWQYEAPITHKLEIPQWSGTAVYERLPVINSGVSYVRAVFSKLFSPSVLEFWSPAHLTPPALKDIIMLDLPV